MKTQASEIKRNPVVSFPNGKQVKTGFGSKEKLTIRNNALGEWIARLNNANGMYFLYLDASSPLKAYSIHYKCNLTGKVIEMSFGNEKRKNEDPKQAFIDSLLLDLGLFKGDELIIVFDKQRFENYLQEQFPILFQHTDALDSVLDRLLDLKEVFDSEVYYDTMFKETSIKEIHQVLYGRYAKIPVSLAMFQIFEAIQSIYYQVTGLKVA